VPNVNATYGEKQAAARQPQRPVIRRGHRGPALPLPAPIATAPPDVQFGCEIPARDPAPSKVVSTKTARSGSLPPSGSGGAVRHLISKQISARPSPPSDAPGTPASRPRPAPNAELVQRAAPTCTLCLTGDPPELITVARRERSLRPGATFPPRRALSLISERMVVSRPSDR
jgi:hypothetical protein